MKTYKHKKRYTIIIDNLFSGIEQFNQKYNIIVPHVCNNSGNFGGGFASAINKYYPIIKENYNLLGKKCCLGYTQFIVAKYNKDSDKKIVFANMIAQNGDINYSNPRPLNYYSLAVCMRSVDTYIKENFDKDETQIHTTKFGCGLSGGDWNFIENLIEDIWTSAPTFIYVHKK